MNRTGCLLTAFMMIVATTATGGERHSPVEALLPKELAPDVYVLCASHRFGSATVGWVTLRDESILIDCPHPDYLPKILAGIQRTTRKPLKRVILTHSRPSQLKAAQELLKRGIAVYAERQTALFLKQALPSNDPTAQAIRQVYEIVKIQDNGVLLELHPLGHASGPGNIAVRIPHRDILFAGEVCSNGPKNNIPRGHTKRWIEAVGQLERLSAKTVVPAFGGIGGPEILRRQKDLLAELRRRVSYLITQSKPRDFVVGRLTMQTGEPVSPTLLHWFPYDVPQATDIEHLYDELTAPISPYRNDPFDEADKRPRALALIGDRVHDPAHIEECLTRAFSEAGVAVRFAFDVRALSSENLKQVHIFCLLRDGVHWPKGMDKNSVWMTPDQEKAIVGFVDSGGALIGLHNCPGLYPAGGPYLELLGGTYDGHGPLERFRVKVHDADHPIARGVESFEVADEQHTPVPTLGKVHVFLKSYSEEGVEAAAGWARDFGKGRVCYLTSGHTRESLAHPMAQLLLRNAINWCLKREAEEAGKPAFRKSCMGSLSKQQIAGWTVHVSQRLRTQQPEATEKALALLRRQLDEIVREVPGPALAELQKVPLWVSPEYPGFGPKAEYHPDAGWLREHRRDPAMAKAVEFTNVRIFEAETRRMPNFALHELAHAYHDRVLGYENKEIRAAYRRAKAGGKYDRVQQRLGDGRSRTARAYAMENPQEYFAETTEALFAANDFFPFTREELQRHDPEMYRLLLRLWKVPAEGAKRPAQKP